VPYLDPDHLGVTQSEFDNVTTGCGRCHAVSGASPVPDAPACRVCHTAGSPLSPTGSFGDCSSCHGSPPPPFFPNSQPNGTTYPNIAGAHAKHLALDNNTIAGGSNVVDCDTCHSGLGFVTQAHYDRANARPGLNVLRVEPGDLSFPPLFPLPPSFPYVAQSGTVTFDNNLVLLSCAAIKCHGGFNPTPNWRTGTIATLTDAGCVQCHKSASVSPPQFNDYTNTNTAPTLGMTHAAHAGRGATCTTCHDPAQLTQVRHFGGLADNTFPAGAAAATIRFTSYNPARPLSQASCATGLPGCH
jgi:predicted CxxxxCH...CXXCH cytochrome family protein